MPSPIYDLVLILNLDEPTLSLRRCYSLAQLRPLGLPSLVQGATLRCALYLVDSNGDYLARSGDEDYFPRTILGHPGLDPALVTIEPADFTVIETEAETPVAIGWSFDLALTTAALADYLRDFTTRTTLLELNLTDEDDATETLFRCEATLLPQLYDPEHTPPTYADLVAAVTAAASSATLAGTAATTATAQASIATAQASLASSIAVDVAADAGEASAAASLASSIAATVSTQASTATAAASTATAQASIGTAAASTATAQASLASSIAVDVAADASEASLGASIATAQASTATAQASLATTEAATAATEADEAAAQRSLAEVARSQAQAAEAGASAVATGTVLPLMVTRAVRDYLRFFRVSSSSARLYFPTPPLDSSALTLLTWVHNDGVAKSANHGIRGLCNVTTSMGVAGALNLYVNSSDQLVVLYRKTDSVTNWRSIARANFSTTNSVGWHLIGISWDRTGAPTVTIDGVAVSMGVTATNGTPPAWTDAGDFDYDMFSTLTATGEGWNSGLVPVGVINAALSTAEILAYAQTGRLPEWAAITDGTTTAQTSGTLAVGRRYRIATYVAGDSFTNVGAASNATGVEFTATGTTPTTWTNSSSLVPVGPLYRPVLDAHRTPRDAGGNLLHGYIAGTEAATRTATEKTAAVLLATVAHSGSGNLQFAGGSMFRTALGTHVITSLIVESSQARTWSLGSASGGTEYLSSYSLAAGVNVIPLTSLVTRILGTAALWSNASGATDIKLTMEIARQ